MVGGLLASDPTQIGPYRLLDVLGSGGRWAQGHVVEDTYWLDSVSCASANSCIAADNAGNVYTYSAP